MAMHVMRFVLTERPPPPWATPDTARIDAVVQDVDEDSVTLLTGGDTTLVVSRSVFERRDCVPRPGIAVSFDIQHYSDGETIFRYMSRLMVGERFGGPTNDGAGE